MINAKPKNNNIDEIIHFDAKKSISINVKNARAIYNSNNDNYERLAEIHDVDVETVKKIKDGKLLLGEIKKPKLPIDVIEECQKENVLNNDGGRA